MKKILCFVMALAFLAGCAKQEPLEKLIPKTDVELTGNGFQVFYLGGDVKLVMVPNPDNAKEWMLRASVPMMKVFEGLIGDVAITVNLLDQSGMKVRDGYVLAAEDLINLIPKFNAEKNVEKNIVFSATDDSRKYFSYKEAVDMIERTKSLAMNVALTEVEPEVVPEQVAEKKKEEQKSEPVTFNSLMKKYGVYGLLSQYDKALSKKEKKEAKAIEDKLYQICKKVKADPTVPESLAKQFRDYIENEEDKIEDKY